MSNTRAISTANGPGSICTRVPLAWIDFEEEMAVVESSTEFVDFWNDILVPKFTKYRHILVGGLGMGYTLAATLDPLRKLSSAFGRRWAISPST